MENYIEIQQSLTCDVCGENDFNQVAGFYFCKECGTKKQQIVDVECETETRDKQTRKKILKEKTEKPQLTSWETYNYILHGFVEELLSFGAKEDLKLMTLQVWSAYLRHMEVAFFSKRTPELPRLGIRFLAKDAETIYNYKKSIKKRKRSSVHSAESGSKRELTRSKRKLDESSYSAFSASQTDSEFTTHSSTVHSSSSGTTARAIKLQFSSKARKALKKIMPKKHMEKHAKNSELKCHNLRPKVKSLNRMVHAVNNLNLKLIYAILGIALNLIEDEIQLCDLVRFISEEHLSSKNIIKYFPENIMPHCKTLLQQIQFNYNSDKFTDKALREQVGSVAKLIKIQEFKTPNIFKLVSRYIIDLHLPNELETYIERLINLLPPKMTSSGPLTYLAYEARAMAYIIFVLKLLFGLDGYKEHLISESAKKINEKIEECNEKCEEKQKLLFVWSDWLEYVEMRKLIVSRYKSSYSKQFNQNLTTEQMYDELLNEQRCQAEEEELFTELGKGNTKLTNLQEICKTFMEKQYISIKLEKKIKFQFSYTPSHAYFKRIQLHLQNTEDENLKIPKFMNIEHKEHTLKPYINATTLSRFLKPYNYKLKINPIECNSKRNYVGIFRAHHENKLNIKIKPDFKITEEEWLQKIIDEPQTDFLEFKTEFESYNKTYMQSIEAKSRKRRLSNVNVEPRWKLSSQTITNNIQDLKDENAEYDLKSINSLASFNIFEETDMEPLDINFEGPRRNIEKFNFFENLSDDELEEVQQAQQEAQRDISLETTDDIINAVIDELQNLTLITSKMDCWILAGYLGQIGELQKKKLQEKLPTSFFWLLETCAQTLGVDWNVVYEQLLTIEMMFGLGIKKLDNFDGCIHYLYNNKVKDINLLINSYRAKW